MRKCRSEFGRKIFSISRAIITTVFAHGAFGFLLAFPIRELLLRFSGIRRGVWSFALPVAIILAVSGCFEIIESIVAEIVAPGKGVQWLGGQGDEWDAQNDMVSALVGSLLMVGVVALLQRTEARPRFHSVPVSPAGRDARASGSEGTGVGWGEEDAERNIFAHSNARDIAKHFSAHCGCLLCCVLDCTGDPSARSQRLVARKSPRRYIAKGSNGGTARGSTENLTYTGLTACVASAT